MVGLVADSKMMPPKDQEILTIKAPCAFAKSKEIKEVGVGLDDPSKTVKIGANLDPK